MYFIGIGVGILLLVWFLQIFFLNNYYEHMKTTEVNRVASSIYHAYARGDAGLTASRLSRFELEKLADRLRLELQNLLPLLRRFPPCSLPTPNGTPLSRSGWSR